MLLQRIIKHIVNYFGKDRVFYYSGQSTGDSEPSTAPWIVVLGRGQYSEWIKRYPVADEAELKAILASQQNDQNYAIYQLGPVVNQQRQVQCWQFDKELFTRFPAAKCWLPESWLIKPLLTEEHSIALVQSPGGVFFAALKDEHIVSASRTPMLNSTSLFCSAHGLSAKSAAELQLSSAQIFPALENLSASDWWRGCRLSVGSQSKMKLTAGALALSALFVAYQILSSVYLLAMTASFEAKQSSKQQQIEQMLQVQNRLQNDTELLAVQQRIVMDKQFSYPVWALMAALVNQGAELTNVQFSEQKVLLRGQSASATDVLTFLQKQPWVKKADFESAVRRQGDKESFVILLQLSAGSAQ